MMCQAQLRQWSFIYSMYTQDNHDKLPSWLDNGANWWPIQLQEVWLYYRETDPLFLCPVATKPNPSDLVRWSQHDWNYGSTSTAWTLVNKVHQVRVDGSYGVSPWAQCPKKEDTSNAALNWRSALVKDASRVPLCLDSMLWWASSSTGYPQPPAQQDRWACGQLESCIDRHEGSVNGLFLDWSIRPIGLKELWTVKWHPRFNTAGPWTRAGGVQLMDWPEWMRPLKDY